MPTMEEKKEAIRKDLAYKGYAADRFGHMKKETKRGLHRYKFQAQTIRFERQIDVCGKNEWMKIGTHSISAVYAKLEPYIEKGYSGRIEYLDSLAEEHGLDRESVIGLAQALGPNEDFDGLVSTVEDHARE